MFEVYCLTSPSGKRYVGFTSQGAERRWRAHVRDAKRGRDYPLYHAIRKYGPDAFSLSLLERMTTDAGAKRAEQLWIKELGTFGPGGYNATLGGEGMLGAIRSPETRAKIGNANRGKITSPETRAKMSAAALRLPPRSPETAAKIGAANRGKKRSPETRAKMSQAHRGRVFSPETRVKIGESQRGKVIPPESRAKMSAAAKRRSPETRAKQAESLRGFKHSLETRAKMSATHLLRNAKRKELLSSGQKPSCHIAPLTRTGKIGSPS